MILAIDLGSTSFKTAIFDQALNQLGHGAYLLNYLYAAGGRVELEVGEATVAFRNAVREAIGSSGIDVKSIRAIAITSQAQTFTVLDRAGRPKMHFISWQDMRPQQAVQRLKRQEKFSDFARHASFGELLPNLQICQLEHLQETQPGLIAPDDRILNLPTFFIHKCTGVAAVDANLAAMSGLYSLRLEDWWPTATEACRIDKGQLPAVLPVGTVAALTNRDAIQFGLPEGIPVVSAGNDQTAGAYGARVYEEQALLIGLGTAQIAYICTEEVPEAEKDIIRGPYPGGKHYRMAADTYGGNIVKWAQTILSGCETDQEFFAQAGKAEPGCQELLFEIDSTSGEGTWKNIGLHHKAADFARSTLECLSRRMAEMVERLGVNLSDTKILVAGGGSFSHLWVKILSETLGASITITESNPLCGAARMAQQILEPGQIDR